MNHVRRSMMFLLSGALLSVSPLWAAEKAAAEKKEPAAKSAKSAEKKKASKKQDGKVLFSFEVDSDGWRIPDWAFEKSDNASVEVTVGGEFASDGKKALKMATKFPPKMWSGAYAEIEQDSSSYMDFSPFPYLMADVYVPAEAPKRMKAEIILTVGDNWAWTEMRQPVELVPGAWTTIQANVAPDSTAWKARLTPELIGDVRKLGVRVSVNGPSYEGPVFIDNVRLENTPLKPAK